MMYFLRFIPLVLFALGTCVASAQTGHRITAQEARDLIGRFQTMSLAPGLSVHGGALDRKTLLELLAQKNADGLRYYFAISSDNKMQVVFVAAAGSADLLNTIVSPMGKNGATRLTRAQAKEMILRYVQQVKNKQAGANYGATMPADAIRQVLKSSAQYIRFYFGLDPNGTTNVVFAPLDAALIEDETVLLDRGGVPCIPSPCPDPPEIIQ